MSKKVEDMNPAEKFHFYQKWEQDLWAMAMSDEITAEEYNEESQYCTTAAIQNGVYIVVCDPFWDGCVC